ncbi:MAG TPA: hypothetical protein VHA05_01680 [Candidatus Saccharimonadales bacterium]|nr:hypothetical protein [Candidatus Saccharimonadales bacterium]
MRYFIGFLVTIGLLILLIVLLLTGGGNGGHKKPPVPTKPRSVSELASYADTDAAVQMVIDGQINADQNHSAVRVTITNSDVTFEQIQGYEGTVVNTQVYKNNVSAYNNFLYAIGRAGFLLGDNNPKLANEKGYCALGSRFIFTFNEGGNQIQRYWATSCGGIHTYKGNLGLTVALIKLQVPDYSRLTSNINNL